MKERFNLALVPQKVEDAALFLEAAETMKNLASGYCLQPGKSLPHVTLCQFLAKSEAEALRAAEPFLKGVFSLVFTGLQVRVCSGDGYWVEYVVRRHAALRFLQERVVEHLVVSGCEALTPSGDAYAPHLTLLRVAEPPLTLGSRMLRDLLWEREIPCAFSCGAMDGIGQFLRRLDAPVKKKAR